MTRWLDLYVIQDNKPYRITYTAAKVLNWTYDNKHDALKVTGCGMDMHFHTVYSLSAELYGIKNSNYETSNGRYKLKHQTI